MIYLLPLLSWLQFHLQVGEVQAVALRFFCSRRYDAYRLSLTINDAASVAGELVFADGTNNLMRRPAVKVEGMEVHGPYLAEFEAVKVPFFLIQVKQVLIVYRQVAIITGRKGQLFYPAGYTFKIDLNR